MREREREKKMRRQKEEEEGIFVDKEEKKEIIRSQ